MTIGLLESTLCLYSLSKGFGSTLLLINPWWISLQKLVDVVTLSSEQLELRPLHIYILINLNKGLYTQYGNALFDTTWKHVDYQISEHN